MRWPSIGRQSRRSDTAADRSGAQGAPASSSAAPETTGERAWTALPPIGSAWSDRSPLTTVPLTPAGPATPLTQHGPVPRTT
jgi:hypothetical protein